MAAAPVDQQAWAAQKQLSAKACPCPVDEIESVKIYNFNLLHTTSLDNPARRTNDIAYNQEHLYTTK
jgi:hypothetical protein